MRSSRTRRHCRTTSGVTFSFITQKGRTPLLAICRRRSMSGAWHNPCLLYRGKILCASLAAAPFTVMPKGKKMKNLRVVIVGLFLLYAASPALSAQWIDKSGKSIPDAENIKSAENFIAQLILTTDEQGLLKKWNTPSETVNVNTSSTVERNSPISAFIVFGGCKVDQQGEPNKRDTPDQEPVR